MWKPYSDDMTAAVCIGFAILVILTILVSLK